METRENGAAARLAGAILRNPGRTLAAAAAVAALYYFVLLTRGSFSIAQNTAAPHAFDSMLLHLLRGEFDIDPDTIGNEGFPIGARTYTYFGILPALLRLLAMPFVEIGTVNLTIPSCLIAATVAATAQTGMALRALRGSAAAGSPWTVLSFIAISLFAGPQVSCLRPSIYGEVVLWSLALAYLFLAAILGVVLDRRRLGTGLLTGIAVIAGLELMTRVSTAVGLFAATAALLLWHHFGEAQGNPRQRVRHAIGRGDFWLPGAVLLLFVAAAGYVNTMRFGHPLTFIDLHYNLVYTTEQPERLVRLDKYGAFNLARIWYGLLYYFVPVWMLRDANGLLAFAGFRHEYVDMVELPPSSFFISDPLLLLFAGLGVARIAGRGGRERRPLLIGLGIAFALPGLLMLCAPGYAFRYRAEFYPLFLFLALTGLRRWAPSPRLASAVPALALVSIAAATILLGLHYLSPFGDSEQMLKDGWIAGFRARL